MKKLLLPLALLYSFIATSQCACCAGAGLGSSNGDFSTGILTLSKGQFLVEAYTDYRDIKNGDTVEENEKLLENMLVTSLGARYGITGKLTLSAMLPYVFLYTNDGNDKGFGDLIMLGTYKFYSRNQLNVAVQVGAELPTGIQKESNFDNTTVVVGSGSYDPIGGFAVSKQWKKIMLQANAMFKYTTKGFENNYYGSLSVHNLSVAYQLVGENTMCAPAADKVDKKMSVSVSAFAGYYGEWLDKIKEDEIVDNDSGHYLGFANLGTNISVDSWSFPLTVSLPVVNDVNGEQNLAGYRLRVGILKSF